MPKYSATQSQSPSPVNMKAAARFRRDSFWQITFPVLMVGLCLLVGMGGLVYAGNGEQVSTTAGFALTLLLLPLVLIVLIVAALIAALAFMLAAAMGMIPPYAFIVQKALLAVQNRVERIAGSLTGALIGLRAFIGGFAHYNREQE